MTRRQWPPMPAEPVAYWNNPELVLHYARSTKTPTSTLKEIYTYTCGQPPGPLQSDLLAAVAGNPNSSTDLITTLHTRWHTQVPLDRAVSSNRAASPTLLAWIAENSDRAVARFTLRNPRVPVETLAAATTTNVEELATETSTCPARIMLESIAGNHAATTEILHTITVAALADVGHRHDRSFDCTKLLKAVAGNPNVSPDTLDMIISNAAGRLDDTTCTHPTARQLSNLIEYAIRVAPACPTGAIERAAHAAVDQPHRIQEAIAGHENTPEHLLRLLEPDYPYKVSTVRVHRLRAYVDTLQTQARDHGQLLLDQGFPGWPLDLGRVLGQPRTITVTPAARSGADTPTHIGT